MRTPNQCQNRPELWVGSVKGADRAGAWLNDRRRARLADVMKASSNRLGFTVIKDAARARWANCTNVEKILDLAGHGRCGSHRRDRFGTTSQQRRP